MTITVGDRLPNITLKQIGEFGIENVKLDDLCKGKKVVLFAVPGAFSPTCSGRHLPGYIKHYDAFKEKGIDVIICIAVNDAFVLDAWKKAHNVDDKIALLSDGNEEFTKAVGLEWDATALGMGIRSQRYAMIVNNCVIQLLNVDKVGELEVSNAETILKSL